MNNQTGNVCAPFASCCHVSLNLCPSYLQKQYQQHKRLYLWDYRKILAHSNNYPFCAWICCWSGFSLAQVCVIFQHLAEPYTLSSSCLYLLPTLLFLFLPPSNYTVRLRHIYAKRHRLSLNHTGSMSKYRIWSTDWEFARKLGLGPNRVQHKEDCDYERDKKCKPTATRTQPHKSPFASFCTPPM